MAARLFWWLSPVSFEREMIQNYRKLATNQMSSKLDHAGENCKELLISGGIGVLSRIELSSVQPKVPCIFTRGPLTNPTTTTENRGVREKVDTFQTSLDFSPIQQL